MGALLVCWVLLPAVLGALSLGCGLALERAAGAPLPNALLIPAGFATLIVLAGLPVAVSPLAKLTTPLVVVVAIVGLLWGRLSKERRLGSVAALAVVVFLVYGAPVILSGDATFLGFDKLDDTATWLGITDWVMSHGRDLSGLAPSTYEYMLKNYVGTGYPVGSFLPLGIGHLLVREDVAWLFQPTISFMGAILGMTLYGLVEPLVRSPLRRAVVAAIGAQPALLIGYAWWGSIKEIAAAGLIALAAALAAPLLRGWPGLRGLLPLAVTAAAFAGVYSAGGVVWLLPVVLPAAAALVYRYRGAMLRAVARLRTEAAVAVVCGVVLFLAALLTIGSFAGPSLEQFSTTTDLGVLHGPLSALQGFGIWPSGDLRSATVNGSATDVLVAIAILGALAGVTLACRRRGWGLVLYAFVSLVSGGVIFLTAGPWVAAKALALASPAAPFCALAAAAIADERGRRLEAGVVAVLVAGGVLWSNVIQYHAVNLAPRGQLRELQQIGGLIAGQGPTLLPAFDPYGARHFLRDAAPDEVSDLSRPPVVLRGGQIAPNGTAQDLDAIELPDVLQFRTLVIRTSPVATRPPSAYRLIWQGRFYQVWQRPQSYVAILAHLSVGNADDASGVPACGRVLALARTPGIVKLAYVLRDERILVPLAGLSLPPGWTPSPEFNDIAHLGHAGQLNVPITVTHLAEYRVWVGNSLRARLEVLVDGHDAGSGRQDLNFADGYTMLGSIVIAPGRHTLTLRYDGPDWHPGSGGAPPPTGPVVLADQTANLPVQTIAPSSARTLCGRRLDWAEALG